MANELQNNDPVTGNFIFGKEIINNGQIISEGKRPVNHIQTDKYSGKGIVSSKQIGLQNEKWYQKWWMQYLIFPLTVGIVLVLVSLYIKGK